MALDHERCKMKEKKMKTTTRIKTGVEVSYNGLGNMTFSEVLLIR
jgi:hypothetical protein